MSTRATSWSEQTLRRVAWATWAFVAAMTVTGFGLQVASPPTGVDSTWGSNGFLTDVVWPLMVFTFPCVGLLVALQQPRNRMGWLLLGIGVATALPAVFDHYAVYGLAVAPGSLPGADVAAALSESDWVWFIGSVAIYLVLLFPDGRLPSPRWRWLAWTAGAVMIVLAVSISFGSPTLVEAPVSDLANPLLVPWLETLLTYLLVVLLPLFPLCISAAAVALVLRFRRSQGIERLQLKWLSGAGAVVAVCFLAAFVGQLAKSEPFSAEDNFWQVRLQDLSLTSFALVPVAIGIAILRHRLYDIDRVVNRTLVYGSLTLVLAVTYLGLVLAFRALLDPITGDSDLAVAASTLAVAALFRPARRRIQQVVDRRFFRGRYDATQTVESFAGRLRQEVDLDAVSDDLRSVVRDTVQPAHVSLWLRGTA